MLKVKQIKTAGQLKVRVLVTLKRLMQQDGVESLQSDRESLKQKLSLLIIGRDRSDLWPPNRLRIDPKF